MNIQQEESGNEGLFFITEEDHELAEMVYQWDGDKRIIIDHTEVDPSLEGKGIGKALVARAVEFAREKGITILPICPYAKKVMERTPEYADVLSRS
jgi:predicted GNAT family acetyltransferase